MSLILFIYAIGAFCLAVGLSVGWSTGPAPRLWYGGLASLGAWIQFLVVLFYIVGGHGAAAS